MLPLINYKDSYIISLNIISKQFEIKKYPSLRNPSWTIYSHWKNRNFYKSNIKACPFFESRVKHTACMLRNFYLINPHYFAVHILKFVNSLILLENYLFQELHVRTFLFTFLLISTQYLSCLLISCLGFS
jgi:hypothetical protein